MGDVVVFGAGGRAGTAVVDEALRRGLRVTAAVRDPAKCPGLAAAGAVVVAGDVRDAASVASAATGHTAAVQAAASLEGDFTRFFADAARALLAGAVRVGARRVVAIGLAANLEVAPGVRMMDTPEFPADYRPWAEAHAAGLDVLRGAPDLVDWALLTPPIGFDHTGPRTGAYRIGGDAVLLDAQGRGHVSYQDFAIAVVDEVVEPTVHRARAAVAD